MLKNSFSYIEAPIYQGQTKFGVTLGPAFIRQCLKDQGFEFNTFSALARQSHQSVPFDIYEELSYIVERELRCKKKIFISGGDHSLSIGSVQGLLRCEEDLKVIWVDAHGDINTRATSSTGSYHGMPVSFLLGEEKNDNQDWFSGYLKPENLIYFGVRDLDPAEKRYRDKNKITYYTAADIKDGNTDRIIRDISAEVRGAKVHLSVDSDAFDPVIAPSTGVPVENGLDFETVLQLIRTVQQTADVISYEYVELNPQIFNQPEDVFKTAQIGIDLFKEVLRNSKQKESYDGFHDRYSHPAWSNLLHSTF